jgi:hypothetical protein
MQRMDSLTREVERLQVFENECSLKDDLIEQLHEEITGLQNFIRQVEVGYCAECRNVIGNKQPRLMQLQREETSRQVWKDTVDTTVGCLDYLLRVTVRKSKISSRVTYTKFQVVLLYTHAEDRQEKKAELGTVVVIVHLPFGTSKKALKTNNFTDYIMLSDVYLVICSCI